MCTEARAHVLLLIWKSNKPAIFSHSSFVFDSLIGWIDHHIDQLKTFHTSSVNRKVERERKRKVKETKRHNDIRIWIEKEKRLLSSYFYYLRRPEMTQRNMDGLIFCPIILFVFIFVALVNDHQQRGFRFQDELESQLIPIENAIESLKDCQKKDLIQSRALLHTLKAWTDLARSNYISYWISHKTLSDYVRFHGLDSTDSTIDISIMSQDTELLIGLSRTKYSSVYELQIHPQWQIPRSSHRSKFEQSQIDFVRYNGRFVNRQKNVSIHIWPVYGLSNKNFPQILCHDRDSSITFPVDSTFPLNFCVFSGVQVWCPARPSELVTSVYRYNETSSISLFRQWNEVYSLSWNSVESIQVLHLFLSIDWIVSRKKKR